MNNPNPDNMDHQKIRAMIVEDEPEALDLLSGLLEGTGLATVIASTTEPSEAIDLIVTHEPGILFLDIRMPGMSGFDILNDLNSMGTAMPHVVFTTAHDEYAIKAFDYAAFDYLLKPIDPDRLTATLIRHNAAGNHTNINDAANGTGVGNGNGNGKNGEPDRQSSDLNNEKILIFRGVTGVTFIDTDDVVFITADGNYSSFHFISGRVETVTALIGNVEMHLGRQFFRTGRSCIINTAYLARIDMKQMACVFIRGEREYRCEISRDKVKMLMDHIKNRISER
jgi:two-component system LytT family response regulator